MITSSQAEVEPGSRKRHNVYHFALLTLNLYFHMNPGSTNSRLPRDLSDQLILLIEYSEHIKAFNNWWDWIQVEAPAPTSSKHHSRSKYRLEALKDKSNIERWNHLLSQYTSYVNLVEWFSFTPIVLSHSDVNTQIRTIEDIEPTLFQREELPDHGLGGGGLYDEPVMVDAMDVRLRISISIDCLLRIFYSYHCKNPTCPKRLSREMSPDPLKPRNLRP